MSGIDNATGNRFIGKALIAFGILVLVVGALIGLYVYEYNRIDYSAIDYIKSNRKGAYTFIDTAKDINVVDINSFGYIVKGDKRLDIHYGELVIEVTPKGFDDPEYNRRLKEIGIVIKYRIDEDGLYQYRVEYCDEPIEEWSLVR